MTDERTGSVGDDFPRQQARVRECLKNGLSTGPAGAFDVAVCERALARAERAMAGGDVVEILGAYEELRGIQE